MSEKNTDSVKHEEDTIDLDALEASLAELNDEEDTENTEANSDTNVDESDVADVVSEIELDEAKAESYASQEGEESDEAAKPSEVDESESKPKTTRKNRVSMANAKKSDVVRDRLGHAPLILTADDGERDHTELEKVSEERLEMIDDLAKKVGEKAVNLLDHVNNDSKLSTYTKIALELLIEKGSLTTKELIAAYLSHPYSEGTSRSQCHQMFKLFPALMIVDMSGKVMIPSKDSVIIQHFKEGMSDSGS